METGGTSASAGSDLSQQVSIALARKAQDQAKAQGDAVVALIQQAGQIQKNLSGTSLEAGKGVKLDVRG